MNRRQSLTAICVAVGMLTANSAGFSAPQDAPQSLPARLDVAALVARGDALIDVILEYHIEPLERQDFWRAGMSELLQRATALRHPENKNRPDADDEQPPDPRLARVPQLTTRAQFVQFAIAVWSAENADGMPLDVDELETAFIDGILATVPGGVHLIEAKEATIEAQLRGNRYIGTGIALSYEEKEQSPRIANVFSGGPMQRAGGRLGDLIVKIGDQEMRGRGVLETVELLRGEEGTIVTLVVKSTEGEERNLTVTRGPVLLPTLAGLDGKETDYRIPSAPRIRYVKIIQINGSTVHDLGKLERQFKAEGAAGVILDFRTGVDIGDLHHAILLGDALLDGGLIGRVRTRRQVQEFRADRDRLFRDCAVAILVDRSTRGRAEWIAAALQDNHAATLVGDRTGGSAFAYETIRVPERGEFLELATGILERPNGAAIHVSSKIHSTQPTAESNEDQPDGNRRGGVLPDVGLDANSLKAFYSSTRIPNFNARAARPERQRRADADPFVAAAIRELELQLDPRASRNRESP
jgi:C-terminal peptidase prc